MLLGPRTADDLEAKKLKTPQTPATTGGDSKGKKTTPARPPKETHGSTANGESATETNGEALPFDRKKKFEIFSTAFDCKKRIKNFC